MSTRVGETRFDFRGYVLPWSEIAFGLVLMIALLWMATFPYPGLIGRITLIVGLAVAGGTALVWAQRRKLSNNLVAVLALIAISGVSSSTLLADNPGVAFQSAIPVLVCVTLFLILGIAPVRTEAIVVAVLAVGLVMALRALMEGVLFVRIWYFAMDELLPGLDPGSKLPVTLPRFTYRGLSHNYTAMVGAILLPFTLMFRPTRQWKRALLGLTLSLLLLLVLLTGSRGGLLASAIGILVSVTVRAAGARSRRRAIQMWLLMMTVLISGVLAVVISGVRPDFLFRDTLADRVHVMEAGWEMYQDAPYTGHGPGGYVVLVDRYLGSKEPGFRARVTWNNAHNGYIQILAEYGTIGFLATVGGILTLVVIMLVRFRTLRSNALASAVIGGLAAFAVHSLIEVPSNGLAPLVFLAVTLAIGARLLGESGTRSRLAVWIGGVCSLALAILITPGIGAHSQYEAGVAEAYKGDWAAARTLFQSASDSSSFPLYLRSRIKAASEAGEKVGLSSLETDLSSAPSSFTSSLNLLTHSSETGKGSADTEVEVGTEMLYEEVYLLQLGSLLDASSQSAEADRLYEEVLRMNPWLVNSPFWTGLEGDVERRDRLIENVAREYPCQVGHELLLLGYWPTGLSAPQGCPNGSVAALTAEVFGGGLPSEQVELGLSRSSDDIALRRLAGVQAYRASDHDNAIQHWTIAGLLGDPWSSLQLGCLNLESSELVARLMSRNFRGFTPVIWGLGSEPFYVLDHSRTGGTYRRAPLSSNLIDGRWVTASTGLHEALLEALLIESANPLASSTPWSTMCLSEVISGRVGQ